MTREEAIQILNETFINTDGHIKPSNPGKRTALDIHQALVMAIEALLQPSLPTDLDEVAEKYAKGEGLENALGGWEDMSDAFKAGAEWMAQQGETIFDTIDIDGQGQRWLTDNLLQGDYDCGEEVIVQIRKK